MYIEKVENIKKALVCCMGADIESCKPCPYFTFCVKDAGYKLKKDAHDTIDMLQKEVENKKI